jgi:hypothetical protein
VEAAFVIVEIVLAGLVFIFNLLRLSGAISLAFAASFVVIALYLAFSGIIKRTNRTLFLVLIFSLLNVLINGLLSDGAHFSFDYFKKIIFFFTSIIFFELSSRIRISSKTAGRILKIILALTVFLLLDYFLLDNRTMLGRYLTLGFSNPNFTAMWLMHLELFLAYCFVSFDSILLKTGCVASFAIFIRIILYTQNRSTLFVLAVFAVLLILGIVRKHFYFHKVTLLLVVLAPFLVYLLYQTIVSNAAVNRLFAFAVSVGKGLNSRMTIWNYATRLLTKNGWLFGDYASLHFNNETGMLQMHNSNVDILVSYGILPFILFLKLHYDILIRMDRETKTLSQYVAFCGFLSVMLLGIFEAGIYSGCTGLNFLSGALLLLVPFEDSGEQDNDKTEA